MNRIIPREYILAKEPKKQKLLDEFGLAQKSVFANLYILTKSADANILSDTIHKILNGSSVNGGASVLPELMACLLE